MTRNFILLGSYVAVIFTTLIIGGPISSALAENCNNTPLLQVNLKISKSDVREAFDISEADIQRLAKSTGKQPFWPGLGASSADIAYAVVINENTTKKTDGSYCASLTSAHIVISLKDRVIHLARELKENPCLERIQKERLLKLAHDDELALEELPIKAEVHNLLGQIQPSRAESELAAKAKITAEVHQKIEIILDKVRDYKTELDRRANAPEEIDRLRHDVETGKACHGQI